MSDWMSEKQRLVADATGCDCGGLWLWKMHATPFWRCYTCDPPVMMPGQRDPAPDFGIICADFFPLEALREMLGESSPG